MKQYYCFLERFNNYFNRKIIRYETLAEYESASANSFIPVDIHSAMLPFDFNPNDNIMTEIIANDVPFHPDYFLLLDKDQNIVERWFVLEQKRNRQGQWLYQLRRDVVAEYKEEIKNAPIYVHKGMLPDNSPFIVNDEGLNVNQIKTEETLLKDKSKSAWIVGYIAKNAAGTDVGVNIPISKIAPDAITVNDVLTLLANTFDIPSQINTESKLIDLFTFPSDPNKSNIFIKNVAFTYSSTFNTNGVPMRRSDKMDFSSPNLSGYSYELSSLNPFTLPVTINATQVVYTEASNVARAIANQINLKRTNIIPQLGTLLSRTYLTSGDLAILTSLQNQNKKLIYNGKYYDFNIQVTSAQVDEQNDIDFTNVSYSYIKSAFVDGVSDYNNPNVTLNGSSTIRFNSSGERVVIQLIEYTAPTSGDINTTISSSRLKTFKQEFDAFAIPSSGITLQENGIDNFLTCEYAQEIASAIATTLDASCYDIQLLPYCPIPERIAKDGTINIDNMVEGFNFDWINIGLPQTGNITLSTQTNLESISVGSIIYGPPYTYTIRLNTPFPSGVILTNIDFNVTDLRGTGVIDPDDVTVSVITEDGQQIIRIVFTSDWDYTKTQTILSDNGIIIEVNMDYDFDSVPTTSIHNGILFYLQDASFRNYIELSLRTRLNLKAESNCNLYRLVSPNYQGSFDFNLAKNGGSVDKFIIECTYKPYTPLIKVAPEFSWLYGANFGDNRGLICGGDFSLPRSTSAWQTYQLNNKNYQNIFNREIQNMDFKYSIEKRNQTLMGIAGILGDVSKGAGAGAYLGGPAGAIAGGVIGGITSGVGMGIDMDTLTRTYQEERSLTIDKFSYMLGNVKALPNTLTKVGSFDEISKIFPFLEFYTCTIQELIAFQDKITFESMTVMAIGYLKNYIVEGELHYFKGELIRCDDISEDAHLLNNIYAELLKGVYI